MSTTGSSSVAAVSTLSSLFNTSATPEVTDNSNDSSSMSSGGNQLYQAHGCMMISAWVLCSGLGIFMPRYFRFSLGNAKLFDTDIWFQLHRILMLLTLFCTAAGFILIFIVNEGQYMSFAGDPAYFSCHAPVGIVVMILVIINPIVSIFRCSPTDSKRPVFNWIHFFIGTTCQILAVIDILIGFQIANYPDEGPILQTTATFWIMVAFVAFHVFIEITLSGRKRVAPSDAVASATEMYMVSKLSDSSDSKYVLINRSLLVGYIIVVFGLWLAMMICICLGV